MRQRDAVDVEVVVETSPSDISENNFQIVFATNYL